MTSDPWYPLLALLERDDNPSRPDPQVPPRLEEGLRLRLDSPPSKALRRAIVSLCEALREEFGSQVYGQQLWLLLDTGAADRPEMTAASPLETPSPLEVGRVLEELRLRFQDLRPAADDVPDFEAFLRERMRSLGFDDLGTAPLLPELQREALRGLGVGIGSQMAQMLGRLAGWHSDARAPKSKSEEELKVASRARLLRLELSGDLAGDRAATAALRVELGKVRRRVSQRLGWELSGVQLAASKELEAGTWRLLLRGEEAASGHGWESIGPTLEAVLDQRAEALLPFAEFDAMLRQPGCKLVVRELRTLGLEKALLWKVCRRAIAAGGHLREPLTALERILEASITSQELPFLVQAVLSLSAEP